ncbi:beta-mannosidase [Ruminiclostridium cellobioparum]|uniref:Beta-mannosidase n=1 Tax=Ruminiclostridium cellobioparum subsp. termitidis CT1112 TaxID=1195236 RepID=S0FFX1_RUMCE|nr:glycoside hydrolase family 2 protein [Ruminiclostridium cellobioparum]EMS70045.1 Beta-galactosidase/beta-glucuronidase [Ruminiclostridium cellobioparum subsp. termitidis CT1112]
MKRINLNENWKLKRLEESQQNSRFNIDRLDEILTDGSLPRDCVLQLKTIPCQVHDALIERGIIENPNIKGRNNDCWIGESDWIYVCDFSLDEWQGEWTLRFGGLDTFADIYLNGRLIAQHNDAFLPCIITKLDNLRLQNTLVLHFKSARKIVNSISSPEKYQGKVPAISMARVFRSGFHEYCGPIPELIRVGIYGHVTLEQSGIFGIEELETEVVLSEDLMRGTVSLQGTYAGNGKDLRIVASLKDDEGNIAAVCEQRGFSQDMVLHVENPRLWWPRTHGAANLYTLEVSAFCGDSCQDVVRRTIGFRRIDKVGDFDFILNGRPLKLWGANLTHMDTVSGCYNALRTGELLELAELGNFNCLRVWGEGEILADEFYEQCDLRGILLWQDFYLCYSMYSEEQEFLELCRREAESLVSRLKHHPSVLLWCGGNEMLLSRDYDHPGEYCWGEKIFGKIFPSVCAKLDPGRYYHESSPAGGLFANDPREGDTHGYTHLWYVPGSYYPVFLSENCRVSAPPLRTMQIMMTPGELWPEGYTNIMTKKQRLCWPETWNQHNTNNGAVKVGPVENYLDAEDPASLIYRLGAAHANYIKRDVERFRRGKPVSQAEGPRLTKGHLLWKFNNNSNIISYGIVDYFNEPGMAYYALRNAYSPLLVSFSIEDEIHVWLTNDTQEHYSGSVVVKLFNLPENKFTEEMEFLFSVQPDQSIPVGNLNGFLQFRREHVLVAYVFDRADKMLARNVDYVDIERHLIFPEDASIELDINDGDLILACNKFARSVELIGDEDGDRFGWMFEDNYFDLVPGEIKRVKILGRHKKGTIHAKPYYSKTESSICFGKI